jgi:5' nucleotidase, deoxy (Pyrimidine), cytosolic type C protein (NT5C)
MKYALDLDGVIFNFVKAAQQVFPSIPKYPENLDLKGYLSPHDREVFQTFVTNPDVFRHLELLPGIKEIIPFLNSMEMYIITARWKTIEKATLASIKEVGLKPREVIFNSNKLKVMNSRGIPVIVEDQPKYVEPIIQADKVAVMPYLSYNHKFIDGHSEVITYHNAEELEQYLKKIDKMYNKYGGF